MKFRLLVLLKNIYYYSIIERIYVFRQLRLRIEYMVEQGMLEDVGQGIISRYYPGIYMV